MRLMSLRKRTEGFTLVELMVTVAVLGVLLLVVAPSAVQWIRNSQVRTVADGLLNGLRVAQGEAVRRNRQVVFSLTNATPGLNAAASANGRNWSIQALPLVAGEAGSDALFAQGGALSDVASGVTIQGPAVICFNSMGRQVANSATGVGADCVVDANTPVVYDIARDGADRSLRILVSLGGQIRMCDPSRTLSATHPDGCPANEN